MFKDEFKEQYTTIPFAIHKAYCSEGSHEVITHYHREIELIAMNKGSADFYIDAKCFHLKENDILIIPPYALHRARTSETDITSYDCICFDMQLLCDEKLKNGLESQALSIEPPHIEDPYHSKRYQSYIRNAFLACEKKEEGWELEAIGNISLLFGELKKCDHVIQNFELSKETDFGKNVMTYIFKNASSHITSRDAANELYMNHSYFCRLFKKTFGCPFANYLLVYRLEKARVYLTNTSLSVTEIAFKSGFNDCSYFGKVFRERFHTSPLSYRKNRGRK